MRHGKKIAKLGRTAPHRKAMLSNMMASLFINERVTTTQTRAKELKRTAERGTDLREERRLARPAPSVARHSRQASSRQAL